jgi:hypothetical protein
MLLERLRRIDDEFLLLNTFNEARRLVGFTSVCDKTFFLLTLRELNMEGIEKREIYQRLRDLRTEQATGN